jgi:hypothetical protein
VFFDDNSDDYTSSLKILLLTHDLDCTACGDESLVGWSEHPILCRVIIGNTCQTRIARQLNVIDTTCGTDGSHSICSWCMNNEDNQFLYCCSQCPRVFCLSCLERNLDTDYLEKLDTPDDDWECVVCDPAPLWELQCLYDYLYEDRHHAHVENRAPTDESDEVSVSDCHYCLSLFDQYVAALMYDMDKNFFHENQPDPAFLASADSIGPASTVSTAGTDDTAALGDKIDDSEEDELFTRHKDFLEQRLEILKKFLNFDPRSLEPQLYQYLEQQDDWASVFQEIRIYSRERRSRHTMRYTEDDPFIPDLEDPATRWRTDSKLESALVCICNECVLGRRTLKQDRTSDRCRSRRERSASRRWQKDRLRTARRRRRLRRYY